eukprot:9070426-Pyramimonas_sp.AAC.1
MFLCISFLRRLVDPNADSEEPNEPLRSVSAQFWRQVRALEALVPPEALDPSGAVEAVVLSRWIDGLRRFRELTA